MYFFRYHQSARTQSTVLIQAIMCFKSPEYVISLCFYHKTQPPPQPPQHTRGIEWLKLIRPHDATYVGQIIAQIQRLSLATTGSKVSKWHTWSTGPCGIRRMVPGRFCTSHTHTYCTHFFLRNSQIHSPPPIPALLAPIQRHSAAWQRLFIGGKKSASLFSCHSQQLSQGPCL